MSDTSPHAEDQPGVRTTLRRLAEAAGQYLETTDADPVRRAELRRNTFDAVQHAFEVLHGVEEGR